MTNYTSMRVDVEFAEAVNKIQKDIAKKLGASFKIKLSRSPVTGVAITRMIARQINPDKLYSRQIEINLKKCRIRL